MVCLDVVMRKLNQLLDVNSNGWFPRANNNSLRKICVSKQLQHGIDILLIRDVRDGKVHQEFEIKNNGDITIKNLNGSVLLNAEPADRANADTACFDLLHKLMVHCP